MKRRRDNEASTEESHEDAVGSPIDSGPETAPPSAMPEDERGPQPWESWAAEKRTPSWLLAAARTHGRWAIGFVVDEASFDATVEAAGKVQMSAPRVRRGGHYGPRKVS